MLLRAVTRADGKRIKPENAWLSKLQDPDTHTWHHFVNLFDANTPGTYTIAFDNKGYVTRPLDSVTDELPPGVTFEAMTNASDISDPPSGSTGTIGWTGPYAIDPQDPFLVQYRATMPTGDDPKVLSNEASGLLGDDTLVGPDSVEVKVSTSHTWSTKASSRSE